MTQRSLTNFYIQECNLYINYMYTCISSDISKFADDRKIERVIKPDLDDSAQLGKLDTVYN